MNRDDIIRMAREAGGLNCDCCLPEPEPHEMQEFIERFAALVAAHERKECVKVCLEQIEAYTSSQYTTDPLGGYRERFGAAGCAAAIRARGEK